MRSSIQIPSCLFNEHLLTVLIIPILYSISFFSLFSFAALLPLILCICILHEEKRKETQIPFHPKMKRWKRRKEKKRNTNPGYYIWYGNTKNEDDTS